MSRSRRAAMGALLLTVAGLSALAPAPAAQAQTTVETPAARTAPAIVKQLAAPQQATYLVQWGDTLSKLAGSWCGSRSQWPGVWAGNPQVADPNRIFAGSTRLNRVCSGPTRPVPQQSSRSTTRTNVVSSGDWRNPLDAGVKASGGGCPGAWRKTYAHGGYDLSIGYGTEIHAMAAGTVVLAPRTEHYRAGYYVNISHGNGLVTRYLHLRGPGLAQGTKVVKGQVIGYVGASGNATGAHLHFEILGAAKKLTQVPDVARQHGLNLGC